MMKRSSQVLAILGLFSLVIAACSGTIAPVVDPTTEPAAATVEEPTRMPEADLIPTDCESPFAGVRLRFSPVFWDETDFCKHSVPYDEFLSGGPPPDGIPAIDMPVFESVSAASEWLGEDWPVMFFEHNGEARAYPLAILIYHEIVNDVVGGLPVALTFCPLCNATIAFDRTLPDGRLLDLGTSGNLRNSDLVMYDRQTFSWWQQFTGEAIVGELTGTVLTFLPSQIIAWSDFVANHPEGEVLSRETGHRRSYGSNPYGGYDSINNTPFLFDGALEGRLPAVERVVALNIGGIDVAYPFSTLRQVGAANDTVAGEAVVVFWKSGTRSTFGSSNADTGSTAAFSRQVAGQTLSFVPEGELFRDQETGSTWNLFGEALDGPLAGEQLTQLVSAEHFWFAWAVFRPETIIWTSS